MEIKLKDDQRKKRKEKKRRQNATAIVLVGLYGLHCGVAKTWTEVATFDIKYAKGQTRGIRNEGRIKDDYQESGWSGYMDGNTI